MPPAASASHPSAPNARNCTASPAIGSTSLPDPYVDNNTRILATPIFRIAVADDSAGSAGPSHSLDDSEEKK
jgi:hypothetical protein